MSEERTYISNTSEGDGGGSKSPKASPESQSVTTDTLSDINSKLDEILAALQLQQKGTE